MQKISRVDEEETVAQLDFDNSRAGQKTNPGQMCYLVLKMAIYSGFSH